MYVCIFTDCNADVNTVYQQSNTVNRQTVTVQQLAATKAPVRAATGVRVLPVSLPATTHIRHFYYEQQQRGRKVGLSLTQISRYSRVLSLVLNGPRLLTNIHTCTTLRKQTNTLSFTKEQTLTLIKIFVSVYSGQRARLLSAECVFIYLVHMIV